MDINCLIVDDEPLSQDVLKDFVEACPELTLKGVCNDALEAGKAIKADNINLLFLDINMPMLSGVNFIKGLPNPPLVIFVTAYPEFALEGFEVDAVDYLLKPVSFERFRKAVNRVVSRIESNLPLGTANSQEHIMVRADKKNYLLNFEEIIYLQAMGDYVKFILNDKNLMVHGTMKEFLNQLPSNCFQQVHKSYVINLKKVSYIEGNHVKLNEENVPVSLTYRDELFKVLGNK